MEEGGGEGGEEGELGTASFPVLAPQQCISLGQLSRVCDDLSSSSGPAGTRYTTACTKVAVGDVVHDARLDRGKSINQTGRCKTGRRRCEVSKLALC